MMDQNRFYADKGGYNDVSQLMFFFFFFFFFFSEMDEYNDESQLMFYAEMD